MTLFGLPLTLVVTVSAGVFGVALGALLKPIVEQYFEARRKTLTVELENPSELRVPHETVKLEWRNHKLEKLITRNFVIANYSGRTIRDFDLDISCSAKPTPDDIAYIAIDDGKVKLKQNFKEGASTKVHVDIFERKAKIEGALVSSYARDISVSTMSDLEIKYLSRNSARRQFLRKIGEALLFAMLAAAGSLVTFKILDFLNA